jgi:rhodanese-related sulfurtransferase
MERNKTIIVLAAIFICSLTQAQIKSPQQIVENVSSRITEITVEDLNNKMGTDHQFILIDVRTEKEYLAGHIEKAIWIPRGFLEFKIQKVTSEPQSELILYCRAGSRSALSTETLIEMGFENVLNLQGGFKEWVNNGYNIFNRHGELKVINFEKKAGE